jgi:hypothetical protein
MKLPTLRLSSPEGDAEYRICIIKSRKLNEIASISQIKKKYSAFQVDGEWGEKSF